MKRAGRSLIALLAAAAMASGCSFRGVSQLPLPGGVDTGDDPYEVKVQFADVLDLVPHSQVRVNDVAVGRVTDVELEGWHAVVTCRLRREVVLPDNAVARISQTSLLGEKFVALSAPRGQQALGRLAAGDVIPLSRSARSTEVEEVLSAISLLLTGGGLEQLSTINRELNAAMRGREDKIKSVLRQVDTFVGSLDRQRNQIVRTIDRVDKLTARLSRNNRTIATAIDTTAPALRVLAQQRADLTKLLVSISELGDVATRVINRSQDDTVANLEALQKILTNINEVRQTLPRALEMLVTFPFPPTSGNAIHGDYTNLYVTLDLDVASISNNLLNGTALEGIGNTGEQLRGLLEPPRTGFPDTPLGVLPELPDDVLGSDTETAGDGEPEGRRRAAPGGLVVGGDGDLDSLLGGGLK